MHSYSLYTYCKIAKIYVRLDRRPFLYLTYELLRLNHFYTNDQNSN